MSLPSLAPKRQRGRLRVQAISEAAIALFAERGFDGTTMTEIAARSGTAIGSLYRFFPTKESLADSLLQRYAEGMAEVLAQVAEEAPGLTPDDLARRLVAVTARSGIDQAAMATLADARREGPYSRTILRQSFYDGLARVLRAAAPALDGARLDSATRVLRQLMKGALAIRTEEAEEAGRDLLQDWCPLVRDHLMRVCHD